ncbi:ankyrin-3 isoform X2 [Diachasma alloeum]|uniref:ankyrin-3 isoform X2 n=1 Tax=Diachasma alloeum TaxID=454923 RepID=UPI0007382DBE|nr:ankyrin-3 isoform X2 [Diachasma alloeum]
MMMEREYPPIIRLKTDDTTAFLRAARSGNLEKVIEYLDKNLDINTANSNGLNALHLASKDGHVEIVTELLKRGAKVDAATKKGNTALHIASLAGQSEIVNILIQYGAAVNIQSQNGFTPLYMAAQENHDHVVKMLLSNGANQSLATEDGFTPLAVAMQQGHDKVVSVLLENDSKGKVRLPALHIAAKKDDCKAADLLLQNDHKPDVTSKSGFTPLHIAAHYGNEEIGRLLIKRGADVNYLAKHNISPLHVAAKWGKNNMVKLLLENSAMIDAKTRDGLTPLHCAARSGHEEVVSTLLEHSAPISARTKNGLAPLHMASQGDHVDAARVLLYHRAPVDEVTIDYLTSLHVAAHCGHVRVAKLLLDRKADPNARALNGFTPLHIACKKNRIKVVELLLKHGASIESTTESGLTPLHVASFMGCMNIVIYLLQHEANPDVPTVRGETPLHLAARANQTDIIRILLRNGAKVDARAREEQTPLHIASRLGNVDIVMLLLQHGAAVDTTTKDMYTALHIASKEGQEEVAAILVENQASVKAVTKNGFTPLHIAAKYGNMNVAKILLQKDSKLDSQGKNDITPLHLACHYDHPNVANMILEKGASPHLPSKNGHTPLHIAARKNQMDIASTLLEHGADPNAQSKAGFSPLQLSAQKGHYDMTNLLIEHGADPNHKSKNGLTALHLCAQEDFIRVASILVKNGANVESETESGYRPIHVAAHFGNVSMIRFLLKHNAQIDVTTCQNYTPLHQAAQQGHAHVATALLEGNASHNARTSDGLTALNIAQKLGYISVMEVLKGLAHGNTETPDNKTWEEKYKVIAPESLQETSFMSDSDDEGDGLTNEQPYRYLTVDLMKNLRDDSLPIDVTRDDPVHRQVSKEEQQEFTQSHNYCLAENFDSTDGINLGRLHFRSFLVSFLVDARGGTMKGCRHSGIRIIVPPRRATMPIRVTCRLVKPSKVANPPALMEGEALATRIIEMGPVGASFLGPVLIDVPHFASVTGKEREIIILRSDNGETWKEHDNSYENDDALFNTPHDTQMSALYTGRITRIITTEFPQYLAIITRIKQEVHVIGADGGILMSSVANNVQAVFPPGALTKKIKVGLQAHVIPAELTAKLLGNCVAVSPVITIEPRRRKFHKPITLTIPVPQAANKGMINQYQSGETPTLRLLCSIAGGTSEAQWEDVTGSTPLAFSSEKVSFTTTVSARFWLMDCRNISEVPKMATELYKESLFVPFITNFVIYTKRMDVMEATLRILCMTDGKETMHTLEKQEEFLEIVKSRDVEALDGKDLYIEFSGNLVPVTKSGQQLKFTFRAFRQNRLSFHVKVRDPLLDPVARMMFMRDPKVAKGEPAQQPICILNIVLPETLSKSESSSKLKELDSNLISKMDMYKSTYMRDYGEKRDIPKPTSPKDKLITDLLQKQQTDAATIHDSLAQKVACTLESVDASYPHNVNTQGDISPELEKQTYSEKRRFWEDITRKRDSYQRSESEVSRASQLTVNESDSEYLQSIVSEEKEEEEAPTIPQRSETLEDLNIPDISECTVAEKAHYFEEVIQKEAITISRPLSKVFSQDSKESFKERRKSSIDQTSVGSEHVDAKGEMDEEPKVIEEKVETMIVNSAKEIAQVEEKTVIEKKPIFQPKSREKTDEPKILKGESSIPKPIQRKLEQIKEPKAPQIEIPVQKECVVEDKLVQIKTDIKAREMTEEFISSEAKFSEQELESLKEKVIVPSAIPRKSCDETKEEKLLENIKSHVKELAIDKEREICQELIISESKFVQEELEHTSTEKIQPSPTTKSESEVLDAKIPSMIPRKIKPEAMTKSEPKNEVADVRDDMPVLRRDSSNLSEKSLSKIPVLLPKEEIPSLRRETSNLSEKSISKIPVPSSKGEKDKKPKDPDSEKKDGDSEKKKESKIPKRISEASTTVTETKITEKVSQHYQRHTSETKTQSQVITKTFTDPRNAFKAFEDMEMMKEPDTSVTTSTVDHRESTKLEKKEVVSSEISRGDEKIVKREEKAQELKEELKEQTTKTETPEEIVQDKKIKQEKSQKRLSQEISVAIAEGKQVIDAAASQSTTSIKDKQSIKSLEDNDGVVIQKAGSKILKEHEIDTAMKIEKDESLSKEEKEIDASDLGMSLEDQLKTAIIREESREQVSRHFDTQMYPSRDTSEDTLRTDNSSETLEDHQLRVAQEYQARNIAEDLVQQIEEEIVKRSESCDGLKLTMDEIKHHQEDRYSMDPDEDFDNQLADDLTNKFEHMMTKRRKDYIPEKDSTRGSLSYSDDFTKDEESTPHDRDGSLASSSSQAKIMDRDITMSPSSMSDQIELEESLGSEKQDGASKPSVEFPPEVKVAKGCFFGFTTEESTPHDRDGSLASSSSQTKIMDRDITMSPSSMSDQIELEESLGSGKQDGASKPSVEFPPEVKVAEGCFFGFTTEEVTPMRFEAYESTGARVLEILEPDNDYPTRQDSIDISSFEIDEQRHYRSDDEDLSLNDKYIKDLDFGKLHKSPEMESLDKIGQDRDLTFSPSTVSESSMVQERSMSSSMLAKGTDLIESEDGGFSSMEPEKTEKTPEKITKLDTAIIDKSMIPSIISPKIKVAELEIKPTDWLIGDEKIEISETLQPSQVFDKELEEYQTSMIKQHSLTSSVEGSVTRSSEDVSTIDSVIDGSRAKIIIDPASEIEVDQELVENRLEISCQELVDTLQREYELKTPTDDKPPLTPRRTSESDGEFEFVDEQEGAIQQVQKALGFQEKPLDVFDVVKSAEKPGSISESSSEKEAIGGEELKLKEKNEVEEKEIDTSELKDKKEKRHEEMKMEVALKGLKESLAGKKPPGDDSKRHPEKSADLKDKQGHTGSSESSPFKRKKDPNVDLSARYAITVLDQVVNKEIAEVKESLEAAKQDLIEELSENSETVFQIKDSPSEFQFKLEPESIPNDLPFLYKGPSVDQVTRDEDNASSESPVAKPRRQDTQSDEQESSEKKSSDKEESDRSSELIGDKSDSAVKVSIYKDAESLEESLSLPIATSRSTSDVDNKDDLSSLSVPPQPAPRRRQKPIRVSKKGHSATSEAESSSGESSNYQSCDYEIGSGSRPSSSDIEALQSAAGMPSTTASEYETAMMSMDHSSRSRPTSQEYHSAVSTLSSRESMKSLNSLSSGHLGSIDSTSELTDTLVASESEIDEGKIGENLELALDEDEKPSDSEESEIPLDDSFDKTSEDVPCKMKRSSEMIFQQQMSEDQDSSSIPGAFGSTEDTKVTSSILISEDDDLKTSTLDALSEQISGKAELGSSSPEIRLKSIEAQSTGDDIDSSELKMSSLSTAAADEVALLLTKRSVLQQASMSTSSTSGMSVETVIEREKQDRHSPDSDSFELVDKPDIIDDFVVIEEVGREAEEFDSEGKSISISAKPMAAVKKFDRDVENLITEATDKVESVGSQLSRNNELFDFESEESPPQASNDDQYSQSYSDEEQDNKKWMEMQFAADPRGYEVEYDRGPLEDIKEEEITDFEAGSSRFGSLGSHKGSLGSSGSMKGSFGAEYDVLAGRKTFSKSIEHDNISMNSLQEFENLESAVQGELGKKFTCGSQDSVNNGSLPRRYITSRSGHGDDVSVSSLKDFEGLEKACRDAHMIELRAKEEEDLLEHESPENRYRLENLPKPKPAESSATGSFNPSTSGSDDYEKRIMEIDEIIRIAQANVEKFDRQDDTTEDISQIEPEKIEPGGTLTLPPEREDSPKTKEEGNIMETSTDSLELEGDEAEKKNNLMCRSSDSLEMKTTVDFPSLSYSDSLNNIRDTKEAGSSVDQFSNTRRISSDSLEMPVLEHPEQDKSASDASGSFQMRSEGSLEVKITKNGKTTFPATTDV